MFGIGWFRTVFAAAKLGAVWSSDAWLHGVLLEGAILAFAVWLGGVLFAVWPGAVFVWLDALYAVLLDAALVGSGVLHVLCIGHVAFDRADTLHVLVLVCVELLAPGCPLLDGCEQQPVVLTCKRINRHTLLLAFGFGQLRNATQRR